MPTSLGRVVVSRWESEVTDRMWLFLDRNICKSQFRNEDLYMWLF